MKYRLQHMTSQYHYAYRKVLTPVSGIRDYWPHLLKYQDFWSMNCILKELCCISEARLDVLKFELWFIIGNLNLPIEQWFCFHSDGACTGLNGHAARESAVLVLLWCYKARGDSEQDLWRYWLSEGCITQWCDKPSGCGCVSKKCEQGEQWSSDLAVSCV